MIRFLSLIAIMSLVCPATEHSAASGSTAAIQSISPKDDTVNEMRYPTTQNEPCVNQPKTYSELTSSFQQGTLPLASQTTGNWVEIGMVRKNPSRRNPFLNCSGLRRGSKFEFVLVANSYSIELHAIGMTYPQRVTLERNSEGSIAFPVDFAADEGPDNYRCRLTKSDTLVCLIGDYAGAEFKKMTVQPNEIYEVESVH